MLWETRLSDVPSNAPVSYSVNGKQYIAIGVGNGGAQAVTFPVLVPEIKNTGSERRRFGYSSCRKKAGEAVGEPAAHPRGVYEKDPCRGLSRSGR